MKWLNTLLQMMEIYTSIDPLFINLQWFLLNFKLADYISAVEEQVAEVDSFIADPLVFFSVLILFFSFVLGWHYYPSPECSSMYSSSSSPSILLSDITSSFHDPTTVFDLQGMNQDFLIFFNRFWRTIYS